MKKRRKKYTQEFKEKAVKLITEQGYQIAEAARNLGGNENMLGRWKREVEGGGKEVAGGSGGQPGSLFCLYGPAGILIIYTLPVNLSK